MTNSWTNNPPETITNRSWWIVATGLIFVSVGIFCSPLFFQPDNLGVRDWDWVLFTHMSYIKSVFQYGQLPFWNPWYCGGAALFQHPQVPVITPAYLLQPFVGLPLALKLTITIYYALALFGMTLLARKVYGLSNIWSIILSSAIFVFNSFWALQISEGHSWIFSIAYIPYIFLGYELYLAQKRLVWLVFSAAFLALVIWSGGIYPAPLTALFLCSYGFLRAVLERDRTPIIALTILGAYAFLFSAPKLLPVADYMWENRRIVMDREYIPPAAWLDIFFGREQSLFVEWKEQDGSTPHAPRMHWGWVEYGCYVGIPLVVLFLTGIFKTNTRSLSNSVRTRHLALLICWLAFFVLFVGDFAYFNPYRILKQLPIANSLHVTGRFLIILTFIASLVLMEFLFHLQSKYKNRRLLRYTIVLGSILIVGDLMLVNRNPLQEAFTIQPEMLEHVTENIPRTGEPYQVIKSLPSYGSISTMYAALTADLGILYGHVVKRKDNNWSILSQCFDGLGNHLQGFELSKPLIFSLDPNLLITNIRFTPNRITFDARVINSGYITLNQNFVRGWSFTGVEVPVENLDHKPAVRMAPGFYRDLSFNFLPSSFWIGLGFLLLGLLIAMAHLRYNKLHHYR